MRANFERLHLLIDRVKIAKNLLWNGQLVIDREVNLSWSIGNPVAYGCMAQFGHHTVESTCPKGESLPIFSLLAALLAVLLGFWIPSLTKLLLPACFSSSTEACFARWRLTFIPKVSGARLEVVLPRGLEVSFLSLPNLIILHSNTAYDPQKSIGGTPVLEVTALLYLKS